MQANLHVGGTLDAPRLNGLVETTNGGLQRGGDRRHVRERDRRCMFDGDRLLVDRFEVSDDDRDRLVAIGELGIVRRSVGQMNIQMSAVAV